jgi:hypothetical protein
MKYLIVLNLLAVLMACSCVKKTSKPKALPGIFMGSQHRVGDTLSPKVRDEFCTATLYAAAHSINVPSNPVTVGKAVQIPMVLISNNPCMTTSDISTFAIGNQIGITPTMFYSGCYCTISKSLVDATLSFTPPRAGNYIISALDSNNSIISATLRAQ